MCSSDLLSLITNYGLPLLAILHFGLAWQLIRRRDMAPAPRLGLGFAAVAAILYAAMAAPALLN